ncbi:MAG: hypothetical protein Q4G36_10615 [Paracoccus sp. (in: a-proteobacteria)]|nr:hypothetical protein [Paracoccus sp. (in: a-proteobacteria)]
MQQIPPEAQVILINALCLGVVWFGIMPSLRDKTLGAMMRVDLVVSALMIALMAALYAGRGIGFSLVFAETGWFGFWLLTYIAMEMPLMLRFCRAHDIDLGGDA